MGCACYRPYYCHGFQRRVIPFRKYVVHSHLYILELTVAETCHINHDNSLADFWIPLLIFAGITVIIQFSTFGYCIKVYLASLADSSTTTNSSGLPSYSNSVMTVTPRQALRRVQRVVQLQWRGIAIVLVIITDVIFFSVVFVLMDSSQLSVADDPETAREWSACLVTAYRAGRTKEECMPLAKDLVLNQATRSEERRVGKECPV